MLPAVPEAEFHLFGRTAEDCGMDPATLARLHIVLHPRATKQTLSEFYVTARLLLYPGARDETFCLAAAEAQCMGVPVVTRGIGALTERVQHQTNGLIAPGDAAFADAAIAMLTDNDLWQRLSTGAIAQRNLLRWEDVAAAWDALLSRTV